MDRSHCGEKPLLSELTFVLRARYSWGVDAREDARYAAILTYGIVRNRLRCGRDVARMVARTVWATQAHPWWQQTDDTIVCVRVPRPDVRLTFGGGMVDISNIGGANTRIIRLREVRRAYEMESFDGKYYNFDTDNWGVLEMIPEERCAYWLSSNKARVRCWTCVRCARLCPIDCNCREKTNGVYAVTLWDKDEVRCIHTQPDPHFVCLKCQFTRRPLWRALPGAAAHATERHAEALPASTEGGSDASQASGHAPD